MEQVRSEIIGCGYMALEHLADIRAEADYLEHIDFRDAIRSGSPAKVGFDEGL